MNSFINKKFKLAIDKVDRYLYNYNGDEEKLIYSDITGEMLSREKTKYKIVKQNYFIDELGNKYNVDNKYVIFELSEREIEVANMMGQVYGGLIRLIPKINKPLGVKTPDYIINNEKFDLKEITGKGRYVIESNLRKKKKQANNFIVDLTKSNISIKEMERQIKSIYISKRYLWIDKIFIIKENNILNVYKRNK